MQGMRTIKTKTIHRSFTLSLDIMIFQNFIPLSLFSSINEGQTINSAVDELIDKHSEGISLSILCVIKPFKSMK